MKSTTPIIKAAVQFVWRASRRCFSKPAARQEPRPPRRVSGFTLAEVLAALMFMAIVVPVAIEALRIASAAGEVAERKSEAVRVAERVLNENNVMGTWNQSSQNGMSVENGHEFRWTLRNEPWQDAAMRQLTAEVTYSAQDREHAVRLSTLMNSQ